MVTHIEEECNGTVSSGTIFPEHVLLAFEGLPGTVREYYAEPYCSEFQSKILGVVVSGDMRYLALQETCFYPEGGGQPPDAGTIMKKDATFKVMNVQEIEDVVIHVVEAAGPELAVGDIVTGKIDWTIRYAHMRSHTASHIVFSSIREVLGASGLRYMGVQLGAEKSRIDVSYGKPISPDDFHAIERLANRICFENKPVRIWHDSRERVEQTYGDRLGITDVTPSGQVRVVEIDGWDVALCCGTHVRSTAEAGPVKLLDRFRQEKGVERIEFAVGPKAYEHFDKCDSMLGAISRLLNAPVENLFDRVANLVSERKKLKDELSRFRSENAEAQALQMIREAKVIGSLKYLVMKVPDADSTLLKMMTSVMVRTDPSLVAVLGSNNGAARLVGAAGPTALSQGVNMVDMIGEAAKLLGGKGGGVSKIAEGAGPAVNRLGTALMECEKMIKNRWSKNETEYKA